MKVEGQGKRLHAMTDEDEKEEARNYLKSRKWDRYLIEAYLNLRRYPFLQGRPDFAEKVNIGVKGVAGVEMKIEVGSIKSKVTATQGKLGGINFIIGGESSFLAFPDGKVSGVVVVCLFLDERRAMAVEYRFPDPIAARSSDYVSFEVEELHATARLGVLLESFHFASEAYKARRAERRRRSGEDKDGGKSPLR